MTDPSKRYWITEQGMKEAAAEIQIGKELHLCCCDECESRIEQIIVKHANSEAASRYWVTDQGLNRFIESSALKHFPVVDHSGIDENHGRRNQCVVAMREAFAAIAEQSEPASQLRIALSVARMAPPQGTPATDKDCLNCIAGECKGRHYYGE